MPHVIGGNRMKKNENISIKKDDKWKQNIVRWKQVVYYVLSAPIMLINRYKI